MGLNLIMSRKYILVIPITKPWIIYGSDSGLVWEPWSYLGFFSLPILQKTWPETNQLRGANYLKDVKPLIKAITQPADRTKVSEKLN